MMVYFTKTVLCLKVNLTEIFKVEGGYYISFGGTGMFVAIGLAAD
jgi:hypothetical protein